jgi:hypothetical protein
MIAGWIPAFAGMTETFPVFTGISVSALFIAGFIFCYSNGSAGGCGFACGSISAGAFVDAAMTGGVTLTTKRSTDNNKNNTFFMSFSLL